MSNAEYRILMGLGREEGVLNVERRMSNIECRRGEFSKFDGVGKGRRKRECRMGKIVNS